MPIQRDQARSKRTFPVTGWIGLALIGIAWTASWTGETPLAHHSFFPLWLGYVLAVTAFTEYRVGSSLLSRGPRRFAGLFLVSIPLWWLFEAFNARLGNWSYELPRPYSWLAYHLEASLAFSTVVPALFATAELHGSFRWPSRFGRWVPIAPSRVGWLGFIGAGAGMIALVLAWPEWFFPLVWIGLFFVVDPLVHLLGGRSIAGHVERGWWRPVWLLFASGLTCGFVWEMWNSRALPKWEYAIPHAEWLHVFEMPLLGYGGYLPFALETYAMVMLANLLGNWWPAAWTQFDLPEVSDPQTPV